MSAVSFVAVNDAFPSRQRQAAPVDRLNSGQRASLYRVIGVLQDVEKNAFARLFDKEASNRNKSDLCEAHNMSLHELLAVSDLMVKVPHEIWKFIMGQEETPMKEEIKAKAITTIEGVVSSNQKDEVENLLVFKADLLNVFIDPLRYNWAPTETDKATINMAKCVIPRLHHVLNLADVNGAVNELASIIEDLQTASNGSDRIARVLETLSSVLEALELQQGRRNRRPQ
jgi:hypothetical protein